jgi:20S proteasome subunit alpha 2
MENFALTTFSRQGKLDQIDFALEAMSKGESSIGICAKDGVVLACEKKLGSILVDEESFKKIELIGVAKGACFSGLSADFRALLLKARKEYHKFYSKYKTPIGTRRIAEELGKVTQEATQSGGVRPFGVSMLVAGYDDDGPHLYQVDPSGAYFGWKATAIGKNMVNMKNFLEKRYVENVGLEDAIHLAILMLKENYEGIGYSKSKIGEMNETNIEIGIIGADRKFRVLLPSQIKDYLKEAS